MRTISYILFLAPLFLPIVEFWQNGIFEAIVSTIVIVFLWRRIYRKYIIGKIDYLAYGNQLLGFNVACLLWIIFIIVF